MLAGLLMTRAGFAAHIDATALFQLHGIAQVTGHDKEWINTGGLLNNFGDVSDTASGGSSGRDTVVFSTFVMSKKDNARLTLGFGTDHVANLGGNDLAIFTIDPLDPATGYQTILAPTTLDITIGGTTLRHQSESINIGGFLQGVFGPDSDDPGTDPDLLGANGVVLVDLADFMAPGAVMNEFSINVLSAAENPYHYPAITAAGSFNTTVVPLPLPAVLFGSGLALLGMIGRRNRR
ncbi:MAG: hypothetical protein JSW45_01045 [Thiotrichales bacterium]|nr:MAG: hypothetical protein JSW45_01045 [Thiotrichales bacterium]